MLRSLVKTILLGAVLVTLPAAAALPDGYTELKYIKGTGTGSQRIVLDYTPSATDDVHSLAEAHRREADARPPSGGRQALHLAVGGYNAVLPLIVLNRKV